MGNITADVKYALTRSAEQAFSSLFDLQVGCLSTHSALIVRNPASAACLALAHHPAAVHTISGSQSAKHTL